MCGKSVPACLGHHTPRVRPVPFYRDHANAPHSLCAHPFPGRNLQTVVSVIGDLTNRELHAAKGSPCQAPYATYTLATCRTGALSVTVRED